MSLINDALKKAKRAQEKNQPPGQTAPLHPMENSNRPSLGQYIFLPLIALFLVAAGGLTIWLAILKRHQSEASFSQKATSQPLAQPPVEQPKPQAPPVTATPVIVPVPVAKTTSAPPVTNVSPAVTDTKPAIEPVPVPVEPPKPVLPKLQGISFRKKTPSAIVDGRTVYVGDNIGEYRVTAITHDTVTIRQGTETKVLTMPK